MAEKNSKISTKMKWRLNHYISIALIITIVAAANMISFKRYYQKEFATTDYLKLSELTLNLIKKLEEPVKITVFSSAQGATVPPEVLGDVQALLEKYEYSSEGRIEVDEVDPFSDFEEARRINKKFNLNENVDFDLLILEQGEKWKTLRMADMAEFDYSGALMQQGPTLKAFKGEEVITSGIQTLLHGKKKKVYFLTGHGEFDPESDKRLGYSEVARFLERQNIEIGSLNLLETQRLPDDMDLLVIAGPRQRISPLEIEVLRGYLKSPSPRLMLMLDPETETGLETLLSQYGVNYENDRVIALVSFLGQRQVRPYAVATVFSPHPAVSFLNQGDNLSLHDARTLTVDPSSPQVNKVTPLAQTTPNLWAKRDLADESLEFKEGVDRMGPHTLAVAIDLGSVEKGKVTLEGAKIVAMGSGFAFCNNALGTVQLDFFLNSVNWMLGQEESLGISPKVPAEFKVELTESQQAWIILLCLLVPFFGLLIGVLIWIRRRK